MQVTVDAGKETRRPWSDSIERRAAGSNSVCSHQTLHPAPSDCLSLSAQTLVDSGTTVCPAAFLVRPRYLDQ